MKLGDVEGALGRVRYDAVFDSVNGITLVNDRVTDQVQGVLTEEGTLALYTLPSIRTIVWWVLEILTFELTPLKRKERIRCEYQLPGQPATMPSKTLGWNCAKAKPCAPPVEHPA